MPQASIAETILSTMFSSLTTIPLNLLGAILFGKLKPYSEDVNKLPFLSVLEEMYSFGPRIAKLHRGIGSQFSDVPSELFFS